MWQSKGLSDETIKPPATSDNSLTSLIDYYGSKVRVKFNKGYLKQPNKLTFDYGRKVNIYIVYELGAFSSNDSDPSLKNCLFGAVTLTKNADIKIWVFWLWNWFDRRSSFSFPGGEFDQNLLIFRVNTSSSAHIDNKKKDILVLGKGPTHELEHTLTAEKIYSINFTVVEKKLFKPALQWSK